MPRPSELGNSAGDGALIAVLQRCWKVSDTRQLNGSNPAHRDAFDCARQALLDIVKNYPGYALVHRVLAWGYFYKDNDAGKAINEYRAAANVYKAQGNKAGESEARMRLALLLVSGNLQQGCAELVTAANLKGDVKFLDRAFWNFGTVNWTQGTIYLDEHAEIHNVKDRLLDVQGDLLIWTESQKSKFDNSGILRKSAGRGNLVIDVPFTNSKDQGVVEVQVGEIKFKHGGELQGKFNIASGAKVRFVENRYRALEAAFTGDGVVEVLENASLVLDELGGTIDKVDIDNLVLSGGTLTGDGVRIAKHLDWRAGTMAGSGTTYANGATTFRGAETKLLKRKFDNAGTATWAGGDIEMERGAVFNNLEGHQRRFAGNVPGILPVGLSMIALS
ncbi:MAG: hypothetical protein HY741_12930 [Chloroflexi bacterium]|nr:hypothetical protein [Chloroflexota bacterium]